MRANYRGNVVLASIALSRTNDSDDNVPSVDWAASATARETVSKHTSKSWFSQQRRSFDWRLTPERLSACAAKPSAARNKAKFSCHSTGRTRALSRY